MTEPAAAIAAVLRAELETPVPPEARRLAQAIIDRHGEAVRAILFYGSCLRHRTSEGILDFYVIVDDYRAYHGGTAAALFNRLLPPNVSLWALGPEPEAPRAKVAVITRRQFAAQMRPDSLDTTLWTRFCQPVALLHARDDGDRDWLYDTLTAAIATAAVWAARLGPEEGTPEDYWVALFRHTYGAELRTEADDDRARDVYAGAAERYDRLLRPALAIAEVPVAAEAGDRLRILSRGRRPRSGWRLRRVSGKALTIARLVKASYTFVNGVDYIIWKIERHTGHRLRMTPWQRRHPILAAPLVLWRLWRAGAIR